MRALEELGMFVELVKPLTKPTHSCTSLNQLARWGRIQEDKARRTISRMAEAVGDPLLEVRGRRYCLTAVGQELRSCGERLLAVGRAGGEAAVGEALTVEVSPGIDADVLTDPLRNFFREWAGLVAVKLVPLDPEGIKQNLATGVTAFALAFVSEDGDSGTLHLEQPARWSLLVPASHPLADRDGPVTDVHLNPAEQVFVPATLADHADACLRSLRHPNPVVVPSAESVRALVAAGLGVGADLDFGVHNDPEPFVRLSLASVAPVHLGLVLPRKVQALPEVAKALIDLIKESRKARSHLTTGEPSVEPESHLEPVGVVA